MFVNTRLANCKLRRAMLCLVCLSLFQAAHAAPSSTVITEHVRAELLAHAPNGIAPGKPFTLGLAIDHQPAWHTYWKNPGDSGLPTSMRWTLPAGVRAGEIDWPAPHKLPLGPLMNYGYEGQLLLPVQVTLPAGFAAKELEIALHAQWLVCKEICLPEAGDFLVRLPVGPALQSARARFDAARAAVPRTLPGVAATAQVAGRQLVLEVQGLPAAMRKQAPQFAYFAEDAGVVEHAAPITQRWNNGRLLLEVPLATQRSASPATLRAVLTTPAGAAIQLDFPVREGWGTPALATGSAADAAAATAAHASVSAAEPGTAATASASATAPGTAATALSGPASPAAPVGASASVGAAFLLALLFAFAGGAMLNLMPCVFPVLALKIVALTRERAVASGMAYSLGVVLSFVALAGLLLVLRSGGEQLGWGFQLQSPVFVATMAALFTLIGLNLSGVFEFGSVLPASLGGWRASHPLLDDFLSGVLAVAIASPCSAPFMGAAIGATLAMPAAAALAVFAMVGAGMAAPYLLAVMWPGMGRLMPRPGNWMVHFKVLMAFPMFATVIWLAWVLGGQVGVDGVTGLLGILLALALAAWSFGAKVASSRARVGLGSLGTLVLAGALVWAWPALNAPAPQASTVARDGQWQAWSPALLAQARTEKRPVFIDFTAAWCVTCQYNKRTALADPALVADFTARGVLLLRADWTRADPLITRQLAEYGRSGVPVYALYGPGAAQPQILSEILTVQQVRAALAAM